jgi:glutamyl-tRNA synthetase
VTGDVRVRFAPAPTGFLHLGSARSALFNWLHARHVGGTLVLRIEDTDRDRSSEEMVDNILRTFDWLGIEFDEGPYRQSERADLYRAAIDRLAESGRAYWCDLTPEQVQERAKARGKPGYDGYSRDRDLGPGPGRVLRFRTPDEGHTVVDDVIRGRVEFANEELEDFVIQRSDGSPVFLVANAVDDADMRISHVIRGEDLLNTTPKVLLLRDALGLDAPPVYAHLPLIVNEQRKKLSKRRDDVAVEDYRARGFLPEAMLNYLALLGWGPPDGVEVRPLTEIVELFHLEDVVSSPAGFDAKKLAHFNAEWIRRLPLDEFRERLRSRVLPAELVDDPAFVELAPLVQERVRTLDEAQPMVAWVFADEVAVDEEAWAKVMATDTAPVIVDETLAAFADAPWRAEELHARLLAIGERHGLKLGKAQAPVRVAVTGTTVGPPLFESLVVLGRERTLARLEAARKRLAD